MRLRRGRTRRRPAARVFVRRDPQARRRRRRADPGVLPHRQVAPRVSRGGRQVIGQLRGTVICRTSTGDVLIDVGGVGYRVLVPLSAIPALEVGANTFLFTHTYVRDDAIVLYGFPTRDERETFDALIGANGVGPKLALAILSVHSPGSLRRCLTEDDLDGLVLV